MAKCEFTDATHHGMHAMRTTTVASWIKKSMPHRPVCLWIVSIKPLWTVS